MAQTQLFSRIAYGSFFFLFYVVLLGLLLITPGDAIQRSLENHQRYNALIIAICYVVAIAFVVFVYFLRLYVNKTVLASIPKSWVPVDKGDVPKAVYKVVAAGLNRSAAITHEAHPRVKEDDDDELEEGDHPAPANHGVVGKVRTAAEDDEVVLPPHGAPWGNIEHYGWASPNSPDLPNLQYTTVLAELPNLIEAKALTLAPPDPTSQTNPPMLDPEATALLQRPAHLSLREYITVLADLGVLSMDDSATAFLLQYEYARFSTRPISITRFRELMHLFAEVLRGVRALDLDALDAASSEQGDRASFESDIDSDAPLRSDPSTPRSRSRSFNTQSSVGRPSPLGAPAAARARAQYRTAPNTPSGKRSGMVSHSSSVDSFAQSRRPYPVGQGSSNSSLGSKASADSVIRLATRDDPGDDPFVIGRGAGR